MVLNHTPEQIRISNATIYKSLNILQLKDIYNLELGKFMHKAYYRALPSCLNDMFTRIDTVHRYPTSSSRNRVFYQNRTLSASYQSFISTAGIKLWESIDKSLREKNYFEFNKSYRSFLIDTY